MKDSLAKYLPKNKFRSQRPEFMVRTTDDLAKKLRKEADDRGTTANKLIQAILMRWFEEAEKEK